MTPGFFRAPKIYEFPLCDIVANSETERFSGYTSGPVQHFRFPIHGICHFGNLSVVSGAEFTSLWGEDETTAHSNMLSWKLMY